MPIYSLSCGQCGYSNNVSSTDFITQWTCNNCSDSNVSSLPTSSGQTIVNYLLAASILSPVLAALAINVITGKKIL